VLHAGAEMNLFADDPVSHHCTASAVKRATLTKDLMLMNWSRFIAQSLADSMAIFGEMHEPTQHIMLMN